MIASCRAFGVISLAGLVACSPTLNWREVRIDGAALVATLPCKPDQADREVPLSEQSLPLKMLGCEAAGATFAVAMVTLPDVSRSDAVLQQWRMVSTAHLRPTSASATPFTLPGATPWPGSQKVVIEGLRPNGSAVQGQVAYFARGPQLFQALVYADRLQAQQTEPFFAGLRFP